MFRHAQARMADNAFIAVVAADPRHIDDVLADADDPAGVAGRYMSPLAPGGYVVISHSTDEFAPERTHAASKAAAERGATWLPRPREEIARMFRGRELVDPGLVLVSYWRPDEEPGPDADQAWTYCGVAPV